MIQPVWKTVRQFLKNLNIELPYDAAFPLLSIYPKELKAKTQTLVHPCIETLLTIVKRWKQPKCSPTGKWINKCDIYTQ